MERKVYRQNSCAVYAGGLIAGVGLVMLGICLYHLLTGVPLMQQTSKFTGGTHAASSDELYFGIFGSLPFLVLGGLVVLATVNCTIAIDEQGISATNLLRMRWFDAKWGEIESFERFDSNPASGYKLIAKGKTLRVGNNMVGYEELRAEIQRRRAAVGGG